MGYDGHHAVAEGEAEGAEELALLDVVADVVTEAQRAASLLQQDRVEEPDDTSSLSSPSSRWPSQSSLSSWPSR